MVTERRVYRVEGEDIVEDGAEDTKPAIPSAFAKNRQPANGTKFDDGKPRWSLLPAGFTSGVLSVLEHGARKYEVDNWQQVPDFRRRYYDALCRHVGSWWTGETCDPETGIHHLAHAATNCAFLMWFDRENAVGNGK